MRDKELRKMVYDLIEELRVRNIIGMWPIGIPVAWLMSRKAKYGWRFPFTSEKEAQDV